MFHITDIKFRYTELTMTTQYRSTDGIAWIELDNPPVNGLGLATRKGVVAGLERAQGDDQVRAIVIIGSGRGFSGGADIREFGKPEAFAEPSLPAVIAAMEGCSKPIIAAIAGMALGGGLELALGAHYRIAAADAKIGLPEVNLGLLPGAGGTQRFPRCVGVETALQMIVSGKPVAAAKLAQTGLFEGVVEAGELQQAAIDLAAKVADGSAHPRLRDQSVPAGDHAQAIAAARAMVDKTAPHFPAPKRCIAAVEAACTLPFDEGLKLEGQAFVDLINSPESKALRHAFFAERAASKIDDIGPEVQPRQVRSVAVIGAGTMGSGISLSFLSAGMPVQILELKQEALDRGVAHIRKTIERSVQKGRISAEQAEQTMALLKPTLDYADLAEADLIIEAVFEDYAVKDAVFAQLDAVAKTGAILASNTSTLDLDRIAAQTQRPGDVVGMHFFSPANIMKLLEVVRGKDTAKDVMATVMALAKQIRKTAVVSGVCDGFIGNRMIEQYGRQAGFLLDEGALPAQVDAAVERFGMAMGPFRMGDLAGNDIGWAIRKRRYVEQPEMIYSKTADLLCERGRFGQKTGAGWYDYQPGDRNAQRSAEVEQMVIEHSAALGVQRREISDEEIVQRLIYSLVNEGAQILAEGIAARASDIDLVYLSGYGFPLWRGGPMFHADQVGLDEVVAAIDGFAQRYQGAAWTVSPLLRELAENGKRFNG